MLLVAGAALLLSSCDDSAKTFGRSYGECVLKNASDGGDQYSREQSTRVCLQRFARQPRAGELIYNLLYSGRIRNKTLEEQLDASAAEAASTANIPVLDVVVINNMDSKIVVGVEITVQFFEKAISANGSASVDNNLVDTLTWSFSDQIDPLEQIRLKGAFEFESMPPTQHYIISAKPKMVVPY